MSGITIIEEHLCRKVELGSLIGLGIFITLLFIAILWFYRYAYKYETTQKSNKTLILVCSAFAIAIYTLYWIFQINSYNTTHIEYTITIDDSVGFNDFYEKYEIVSVDQDKYRVVEK